MKELLIGGLAAGAITVLICSTKAGEWLRKKGGSVHRHLGSLLNCCFCTSWWVSIAMLQEYSLVQWGATVAIANFTVLGIHMAMSTIEDSDEEREE